MKTFLINLDKEDVRLAAADAQLRRLGVMYERIPAVYGKDLTEHARDEALNKFRWWCAVGRPCRPGEIGCALSHYSIYKKILNWTCPVCVLEDDVVLRDRFKEVVNYVERHVDCSRPQVVLLSDHTEKNRPVSYECRIEKCGSDMYAEGYVITPLAAAALLRANLPMQVPCDWWGRWQRRGIIELYHAFPSVCTQDSSHISNIANGNAFRVSDLGVGLYVVHKIKRLIGKIVDNVLPVKGKLV